MSYGGEVKYNMVQVKILKASRPTFWYANDLYGVKLIGQTVVARKRVIKTEDQESVTYEYLELKKNNLPFATYHFDNNDVEEV